MEKKDMKQVLTKIVKAKIAGKSVPDIVEMVKDDIPSNITNKNRWVVRKISALREAGLIESTQRNLACEIIAEMKAAKIGRTE